MKNEAAPKAQNRNERRNPAPKAPTEAELGMELVSFKAYPVDSGDHHSGFC